LVTAGGPPLFKGGKEISDQPGQTVFLQEWPAPEPARLFPE
jgi:hypothetical protein